MKTLSLSLPLLLALSSCNVDGNMYKFEKKLPKKLLPKDDDIRVPVLPIPEDDDVEGIKDPAAAIPCNAVVDVYNGAEFDMDTNQRCSWTYNIKPRVQVDIVCRTLQMPCRLRHRMSFYFFSTRRNYNFCTNPITGTATNQVFRLRTVSSEYSFRISYTRGRTFRNYVPTGMDCTLRGTGGTNPPGGTTPTTTTTVGPPTTTRTTTTPAPSGTCGLRRTRILGGHGTSTWEYPWQVVLYPGSYICGATLISANYLLTAAHCTFGFANNRIRYGLGCNGRNNCQFGFASSNKIHESYNDNSLFNDIAVVGLAAPASFTTRIVPACLPTDLLRENGQTIRAVGWGGMNSAGSLSNTLKYADHTTVTDTTCDNFYSGPQPPFAICASYDDGAICRGDSGGFVGRPRADGTQWTVDGIVSFGPSGCQMAGFRGFTEVGRYTSWIRVNTDL